MVFALELTKLLNSVYKVIMSWLLLTLFHCFNIKVYIHNTHKLLGIWGLNAKSDVSQEWII